MNRNTLLSIILCLQFTIFFAQTSNKDDKQSFNENIITKKDVDTLISKLRKSFYANDYGKSISEANSIIKLAESISYDEGAYSVSSILGNSLLQINDTVAAKKIFKKQLLEAEAKKDSSNYIGASIDLANVYIIQGNIDKAIEEYKSVMPYAEKLNDSTKLFILNYNTSELYLDREDKENAKTYINETGKYVKGLSFKAYEAGHRLIFGRLLYIQNKPKEAIVPLKQAIEISEYEGYTDVLKDAYAYYAKSEAAIGNYKEAYNTELKIAAINEAKYDKDQIKAVETATAKFKIEDYKQLLEAEELRSQISKQDNEKNEARLMWVLFACSALLLLLLSLLFSYFKRKKLLNDLKEKNIKYLHAKEKSEELANAKSLFFSNISHELRTPLYGIIGLSSILMDDDGLHAHKEDVKSLKFSADYLLSLINDVLQISKLDSKQENSLNNISFNLKDVVYGIMKSFEFLKVQNSNTFNIEISDDLPSFLIGDDVKLSQILINLVGNACKFTENGSIKLQISPLKTEDKSIEVCFKVIDTGIGIPLSKQHEIFDEFTQIKNNGGKYQGTGLGLPIVKKLLELHDSKINLVSEEGKGTEIAFNIVFDIPDENYIVTEAIELESKISINNKTIMVVDDNRINRIVTKKMLEKYNAKPLVAEGGKEAVEMASKNNLDLVLMDINMPGMNGLEATEAIRKFNPTIPVIALTAVEIEEMRENIKNSTICDIIIKPYDELAFVETILEHI